MIRLTNMRKSCFEMINSNKQHEVCCLTRYGNIVVKVRTYKTCFIIFTSELESQPLTAKRF